MSQKEERTKGKGHFESSLKPLSRLIMPYKARLETLDLLFYELKVILLYHYDEESIEISFSNVNYKLILFRARIGIRD
ncbi:hypothetical protein [Cyanobacterium sp. Dongsha4]|uniref:hypothetical protein n=1 Tax=Cyanobacterium sp. DS4 TaxID=2878255 RepID=UPI002E806F73|nr:hypothetical protein [Cyanobacterium sp. Dongsha4]WVL01942.1 hypothetical protein Dongsha4_07085 [Cyanobacterium sp. Dongsha4]